MEIIIRLSIIFMIVNAAIFLIGCQKSTQNFDFYFREESFDCGLPYKAEPLRAQYQYKKATNEIFAIYHVRDEKTIVKLEDCTILDAENWTCGGKFIGDYRDAKTSLVNGELSYSGGSLSKCPPKIVKR